MIMHTLPNTSYLHTLTEPLNLSIMVKQTLGLSLPVQTHPYSGYFDNKIVDSLISKG